MVRMRGVQPIGSLRSLSVGIRLTHHSGVRVER